MPRSSFVQASSNKRKQMARLTKTCPICGKPAQEKTHQTLDALSLRIINLACGHSYTEKIEPLKDWEKLESIPGFGPHAKLYPFQGAGYEFARESGFRCLIADEPGLGKTLQSLACLKLHSEELTPCLVIVKSSLKIQYMKEIVRLCGPEFTPEIISNSSQEPSGIFPITIVTYDLLWRISKKSIEALENAEKAYRTHNHLGDFDFIPTEVRDTFPKVENPFINFGFKTVILDECQQIKNQQSKRAQQVRDICRNVPHVIATSGSPIENNASEYFTILNIMRPERFPAFKAYVDNYCDFYLSGRYMKVGGLRDVEYFREMTKDFIIRRKQKDVLPDLPTLNRKFVNCEFASEKIAREYGELQTKFEEFYQENEHEQDFMQGILALMAKLRHKAGLNKVPFTVEFVTDFINDVDPSRKIVIFLHHQDVMQLTNLMLCKNFKKMREEGSEIKDPLVFSSDLNSQQRNNLIDEFKNDSHRRVMIASTLAASEGLNLQFCSDCVLMERQWNPKKEEQAERRFIRPEGATVDSVNANYIISVGTIDEFLTELVERKRANTDQTLDGVEYDWNESGMMRELAETIFRKGGKKWKIQ